MSDTKIVPVASSTTEEYAVLLPDGTLLSDWRGRQPRNASLWTQVGRDTRDLTLVDKPNDGSRIIVWASAEHAQKVVEEMNATARLIGSPDYEAQVVKRSVTVTRTPFAVAE